MGALHIEKVFLVSHGQLIKGSGLCVTFKVNKFTLLGTSAVLDVGDIKRARYCIEVTLCALYQKLKDAVTSASSPMTPLAWLKATASESDMCYYWYIVMNMEIHILIFVRSIREGNFNAYKSTMWSLMKWLFALDHVHYSRWLSIHLFDLVNVEDQYPDVYNEMMKKNFSFLKTGTAYSRIALDQVHEQNNKVIKGVGGASQLLNRSDESALIRWETCGPDVARIVSEFEDLIADYSYSNTNSKHHEDTPTFREHFINDVKILYKSSVENPFEFKDLTMLNNTGGNGIQQ